MKRMTDKLASCKKEISKLKYKIYNKNKVIERYENADTTKQPGVDVGVNTENERNNDEDLLARNKIINRRELEEFPAIRPPVKGRTEILQDDSVPSTSVGEREGTRVYIKKNRYETQ